MDIITGLMKFDYFLGHKYKPRKIWWEHTQNKAEWSANVRRILEQPTELSDGFAELGITERELQKHAMIELLPFDLQDVIRGGGTGIPLDREQGRAATLLLVLYQQDDRGQPRYFTMPLAGAAAGGELLG
jgi:hypothetical protein